MINTNRITKVATAVLVLFFAAFGVQASGSSGQGDQAVQLQSVTVQDNQVAVQLHNPSDEGRVVTLNAEVMLVTGAVESGAAAVFVGAGATAAASMPFSAAVDGVGVLEINDTGEPF